MVNYIFCFAIFLGISGFSSVDRADELMNQYQVVCKSVSNQRGFVPGDLDAIRTLREQMSQWTASHDDLQVLGAELQLTMWLDDTEQCNQLFSRIADLIPDNANIGLAWADWRLSNEGEENAEEIYSELIEQYPDNPEVILSWAKFLDGKNQFNSGLSALEKLDPEILRQPEYGLHYASMLYANNRFQDALNTLNEIDQVALTNDAVKSATINSDKRKYEEIAQRWEDEVALREVESAADDLPRAMIVTAKGPISVELFEDHAPNTVANFITLAESGFYDGIKFHRVIPKFMSQGGDPTSRDADATPGGGGPGYTIKDEHVGDEYRKHFAGSLSMAKTSAPNSGGSQFFLTHLPTPHLDGRHTVFGRIIDGLETARAIKVDDDIVSITITRKRDHEYALEKMGDTVVQKIPEIKSPDKQPSFTINPQGD